MNLGVLNDIGRVSRTGLALEPYLNRAAIGVLVGDRGVGRDADPGDVDVRLVLPGACADNVIQQVNGVDGHVVVAHVVSQHLRALLNSPQVNATIRPLNSQ